MKVFQSKILTVGFFFVWMKSKIAPDLLFFKMVLVLVYSTQNLSHRCFPWDEQNNLRARLFEWSYELASKWLSGRFDTHGILHLLFGPWLLWVLVPILWPYSLYVARFPQWRQDMIERRPLPFILSANKVIDDISLLLLCSWWQRKESRTQSRRRTSRFRIYRLSQAVSTLVLNVIYPTGRYLCWNLDFAMSLMINSIKFIYGFLPSFQQ